MKAVAYKLGMNAFFRGESLADNPYIGESAIMAEMWDNGYLDAGAEFQATHADLNEEPRRILSDSSWSLR